MLSLRNIIVALVLLIAVFGALWEVALSVYALIVLVPVIVARALPNTAYRRWLIATLLWVVLSGAVLLQAPTSPTSFWYLFPNQQLAVAVILAGIYAFLSILVSVVLLASKRRRNS